MFRFVGSSVAVSSLRNLQVVRSRIVEAPSRNSVVFFCLVCHADYRADVMLVGDCTFVIDCVFNEGVGVLTVALIETGVRLRVCEF